MPRTARYSSSSRPARRPAAEAEAPAPAPVAPQSPDGIPPATAALSRRHLRGLWGTIALLAALLAASLWLHQRPAPHRSG